MQYLVMEVFIFSWDENSTFKIMTTVTATEASTITKVDIFLSVF